MANDYGDGYENDTQMLYREGMPILMDDCVSFLHDKVKRKIATAEDVNALCNCIQTGMNIIKFYSDESGAM